MMNVQIAIDKGKQNPTIVSMMLRRLEASKRTEQLINSGLQYLGFPAVRHDSIKAEVHSKGNNPDGFDCSGFFQFLLKSNGVDIFVKELEREVRYSREFYDYIGSAVKHGEHKRGDFVFFSYDGAMPTHMALYLGDNTILHKGFIDLSLLPTQSSGDYRKRIILSNLDMVANDKRNAGNPIRYRPERGSQIYFTNPIGYKRIM